MTNKYNIHMFIRAVKKRFGGVKEMIDCDVSPFAAVLGQIKL